MTTNKLTFGVLITSAGIFTFPNVAMGQDPDQDQDQATPQLEEIVVTGTRLRADGFEAPTPVTVMSIDELVNSNPTNVVDALQAVPQFIGSRNFESGGKAGLRSPRGQFLSLRNLGAGRTLILLDGVRMAPTTYRGVVNAEVIPQMLLERVDVVTAGAPGEPPPARGRRLLADADDCQRVKSRLPPIPSHRELQILRQHGATREPSLQN